MFTPAREQMFRGHAKLAQGSSVICIRPGTRLRYRAGTEHLTVAVRGRTLVAGCGLRNSSSHTSRDIGARPRSVSQRTFHYFRWQPSISWTIAFVDKLGFTGKMLTLYQSS